MLALLTSAFALTLPGNAPAPVSTFWRGKRVLLAGASSGLGEALAQELSKRGAALVIGARREQRLASIAADCAASHGCAEPAVLQLDVTAEADELAAKAAEAAALLGGGIDVLCYTAGCGTACSSTSVCSSTHSSPCLSGVASEHSRQRRAQTFTRSSCAPTLRVPCHSRASSFLRWSNAAGAQGTHIERTTLVTVTLLQSHSTLLPVLQWPCRGSIQRTGLLRTARPHVLRCE